MKQFLTAAIVTLLGFSQLGAGEWMPWQGLGPGQAEQPGAVEIRFQREESGDDRQMGFLFQYQLRNTSPTLSARVSLAFAWQDPKTLKWEDASIDRATITEVRPKASSLPALVYSPVVTGVDHGALITWLEKKD